MDELRERAVIITGASEGIGRALAKALARRGAWLTLAARAEGRLIELAAEVERLGGKAHVKPTDVTDFAACADLVAAAVEKWGRLDGLVANAGQTIWTRFDRIEDWDIFERLMRLNYLAPVHLTRHALPHLTKTRGRIVAVASIAGFTGAPERTAYAASKHALFGFFDSLRIELRGSGVTVTMVAPDFVATEIHRRALGPNGRPLGVSPMDYSKVMTADRCADLIARGMEKRQRLVLTSVRSWMARLVGPFFPELSDAVKARVMIKARGGK